MKRLNLVLIVVLSLGVVGAALALALQPPVSPAPPVFSAEKLLRHLSDSDPELSQNAADQIRRLGKEAVPFLHEAAASDDPVLAARARRLIVEIQPPAPALASPPPASTPIRPTAPEPALSIVVPVSTVPAGEAAMVYPSIRHAGDVTIPLSHCWIEVVGPDETVRIAYLSEQPEPPSDALSLLPPFPLPRNALLENDQKIGILLDTPGRHSIRMLWSANGPQTPDGPGLRRSNEVTVTVLPR